MIQYTYEATPRFVTNSIDMNAPKNAKKNQKRSHNDVSTRLPSLRTSVDTSASIAEFTEPDVSPEQLTFVANKLDSFLEKQFVEADILPKKWRGSLSPQVVGGVKLLSASYDSVSCDITEETTVRKKSKVKRRNEDVSDMTRSEMLREAAVTPEWVLEGQGVFGKMCHKGEVITGAIHAWDIKKS